MRKAAKWKRCRQIPTLAENDTLMRYLFSDQLKMDGGTLDKMLAEFKKAGIQPVYRNRKTVTR